MAFLTYSILSNTSKHLSWILRHAALNEGIPIDSSGYVKVSDLLRHSKFEHLSMNDLQEIVRKNDYKRFSLKKVMGEFFIRANQGHTIPVLLTQHIQDSNLLKPILNPTDFPTVVHCTFKSKWPVIHKRGLFKMRRNHIRRIYTDFAEDITKDSRALSGPREFADAFIHIDIAKAMEDGVVFYISENGIILTGGIHGFLCPKYFHSVKIEGAHYPIPYSPIPYDYYCIIHPSTQYSHHILDFPIVVLNAKTLAVEDVFHRGILPRVVTNVDYCIDTGVSQSKLDYSSSLKDVLEEFDSWLEMRNIKNSSWIFVTAQDWDLKNTLLRHSKAGKMDIRPYFKRWISLSNIFPGYADNLLDMMTQMRLENEYKGLDALEDVYNITEITKGMLRAGAGFFPEDISISRY